MLPVSLSLLPSSAAHGSCECHSSLSCKCNSHHAYQNGSHYLQEIPQSFWLVEYPCSISEGVDGGFSRLRPLPSVPLGQLYVILPWLYPHSSSCEVLEYTDDGGTPSMQLIVCIQAGVRGFWCRGYFRISMLSCVILLL